MKAAFPYCEIQEGLFAQLIEIFATDSPHSEFWHRAECDCELWYSEGAREVVTLAAYDHINEVHMRGLEQITGPLIESAAREKVALEIEGELVCCDIFERMEQAMSGQDPAENPFGTNPPEVWEDLRHGLEYHDICRFGGWAAAIARGEGDQNG